MGARRVYTITVEDGTTAAAVEKELIRRVLAHSGVRRGAWDVSHTTYALPDRKRPPLQLVTLSHPGPAARLALCDGVATRAGDGFAALLRKVTRYDARGTRAVRGAEFLFADLAVRVGLSYDKGAPVGVVAEVEYRPCAFVEGCRDMLDELMGKIAVPLIHVHGAQGEQVSGEAAAHYVYVGVEPEMARYKGLADQPFSPRHAAVMYSKLLSS